MREQGKRLVWLFFWWAAALVAGPSCAAFGQQDPPVNSAVQFLKAHAGNKPAGESAMIALALIKAEVPHTDPVLQGCMQKLQARFTSTATRPS